MSVSVSQIIDKVTVLLQDTGAHRRWPPAELLDWLNMAQDQVVALKPDALSINTEMKLIPGKTRQLLPDGSSSFLGLDLSPLRAGRKLLDVIRNLGSDGETPGRVVTIVDRKILDQFNPEWHTSASGIYIYHYTYDIKNPLVFYVIPAVSLVTPVWVEIVYEAKPAPATASGNIDLPDEYESVIIDYVLFRAYSKATDSPTNAEKAIAHYNAFLHSLGAYTQARLAFDPNDTEANASPSYRRE
jgi:hypothetical protein